MAVSLTGCGKKLLVDENEKYTLVALSDTQLLNNVFYIKDKTKFYKTYQIAGTDLNQKTAEVNPMRIAWYGRDESLIPTLYEDEIIAYASESSNMDAVTLERFQYNGASMGFFGGYINSEGNYVVNIDKTIKGTTASQFLSESKAKDVKIISVDGEKITSKMINSAGMFKDLEKGKTYNLELYNGTKYMTVKITADFYYLQSFEIYTIDKAIITKNGYISLTMPQNAESGFYAIDGNMFKYAAFKKGKGDEEDIKNNKAYYKNEAEQLAAYSQQYAINIKTTTNNVIFTVEYDSSRYDLEDIRCVLQSPDGQFYEMEEGKNSASITMNEAIAGKWIMNIAPKDIVIKNVTASSDNEGKDANSDSFTFEVEEDETNQIFWAKFRGYGNIWGVVENEEGLSQNLQITSKYKLETDKENEGVISTTFAYLPKGTYKMTLYHYYDVTVTDHGKGENENNLETEIITIEE